MADYEQASSLSDEPSPPSGDYAPALLDQSREAIMVFGLDRRIHYWNAAATSVYGWPAEAVRGLDMDALFAPPALPPHPRAYQEVQQKGAWSGQIRRRSMNGMVVDVQARWRLLRDENEAATAICEFAETVASPTDITRLKDNEARYRSLFMRAPVALLRADGVGISALIREIRAQGVTDLDAFFNQHPEQLDRALDVVQVAEANDAAVRLLGARSAEDLLGPVRPIWPDAPDTFRRAMIARFDGGPHFSEETEARTRDGRLIDIVFTLAFPAPDVFEGSALMGMLDISDRKRAEARLQRLQADFAHSSRVSTLGELTASIAHELKQPLAAIATNGEAALRWLNRETPDIARAKERATRIVEDAGRAADLIQRIRNMAAKQPPEGRPVQLNTIVTEALLFLRHDMDEKKISTRQSLSPDLPDIFGDRVHLQQLVVNLLVNAAQAIHQSDAEKRVISIRTEPEGEDQVRLIVSDTGPGIPDCDIDRIFTGFFTTKPDGMGMGLTICDTIVTAHRGHIGAATAPGSGAVLTVTLPSTSPDAEAK